MLNSPYGPANVRRISFKRLPKAIREAGISRIERQLETGTVTDLVAISEDDWHDACRRFNAVNALAELPGRLGPRVKQIAKMFGATDRTVKRWLSIYRRNPDIAALLPRQKGQRLGSRRLRPDSERLLSEVIDVWAARAERLPVSWIVEECRRRARSRRVQAPSRRAVDSRLRDRGLAHMIRER
jgi:putative transposase